MTDGRCRLRDGRTRRLLSRADEHAGAMRTGRPRAGGCSWGACSGQVGLWGVPELGARGISPFVERYTPRLPLKVSVVLNRPDLEILILERKNELFLMK